MIDKEILKLSWGHLEAFEFDDLLDPINNENFIIIVHISYVPGVKPPFNVYSACRRLNIIQISCIFFKDG